MSDDLRYDDEDKPAAGLDWPQLHTGPDGTIYWVDSAGAVFSPELHGGPQDTPLGVDDAGRWLPRPQRSRRGWTKGKPRGPRKAPDAAPPVPSPVPSRQVPDVVWVVWHAESGQLETIGAYADPVEALERLIETLGGRVSRALIQ